MMNGKRLHLCTQDGEQNDDENQADTFWDLSRAKIQTLANESLSIALLKTIINPDINIINNSISLMVFSTEAAVAPYTTATPFNIYFNTNEYNMPTLASGTYDCNIPLNYKENTNLIIQIINELLDIRAGAAGAVTKLSIDKFTNKLTTNNNTNSIEFANEFPESNNIFRILGINTNTLQTKTSIGAVNTNRDISYQTGDYKAPLLIKSNLPLDSVCSNKDISNTILASVPYNIAMTSESYSSIVAAETLAVSTPETLQKVNLDGSDDHINISMDSNNPVLNWDQSWSIGFTAEEIHDAASGVGVKRTIATRGTNGIYLIIGTGNVGFYASATDGVYDPANNQGMTHSHGANTWYPTPASVKWLFTYNHTTGKLKWYVGELSGLPAYVQRGTITMTATERTINQSSEDLNIGDSMDGYYGSTYFDGHLDDLIITNNELTGQQIVDYYTDDDFQSHEYSEHLVSAYNFNQIYPNVDDQVGSYNGTHQGSSQSDNFISN